MPVALLRSTINSTPGDPLRLRNTLFLCLLAAALPIAAQPVVTFGPDSVQASGISPRSDVIYLGAARIASGYSRKISIGAARLADDDADGTVLLRGGHRVPLHSVWIAVDLTTCASTVATPHPPGLSHSRERLNPGELRQLARDGEYVMFLLVRRGVGAWTLTIEDSSIRDADRKPNRKLALNIADMKPVGSSPPSPEELRMGEDVLFAVDPLTLAVIELRHE